jgi:hypothetical protein
MDKGNAQTSGHRGAALGFGTCQVGGRLLSGLQESPFAQTFVYNLVVGRFRLSLNRPTIHQFREVLVKHTKFIAVLAFAVGLAVPTFAGDSLADFKKFLAAEEPKAAKAFETENIGYFTACTTPDFTMTAMGKTTKKKESLQSLKMFFDMASNIKASFKMGKVTASADVGTVDTEGNTTYDMTGPDKKTHKGTMMEWYTETWKKQGNSWKLSKMVSTRPPKMTMDGKPMNPNMMAAPAKPPVKHKGG